MPAGVFLCFFRLFRGLQMQSPGIVLIGFGLLVELYEFQ